MEFEEAKRKLMSQERDFIEKVEKKQLFEKRNKNSVKKEILPSCVTDLEYGTKKGHQR